MLANGNGGASSPGGKNVNLKVPPRDSYETAASQASSSASSSSSSSSSQSEGEGVMDDDLNVNSAVSGNASTAIGIEVQRWLAEGGTSSFQ